MHHTFRCFNHSVIFTHEARSVLPSLSALHAAFAPAQQTERQPPAASTWTSELELGATAPLGVYDPLGWLDSGPEAFERRRAVERKHGRVAMAAITGCIVHNNHIVFDAYLSPSNNLKFSNVPTGCNGIRAIPTAGLLQILFFFALVELAWMAPASNYMYDGDYGVGWFDANIAYPSKNRLASLTLSSTMGVPQRGLSCVTWLPKCLLDRPCTQQYEHYATGHIYFTIRWTGYLLSIRSLRARLFSFCLQS